MMQPVRQVLAGNAQGSAVLHQADIANVRHLGAADALFHPPHHVAQYALGVVVEFLLNLLVCAERCIAEQRNHQNVVAQCRHATGRARPALGRNVHPVVMHSVQHSSRRRGYPGGIGTGQRVVDLGFDHGVHLIRHGPHAFAYLSSARQAAVKPISTLESS